MATVERIMSGTGKPEAGKCAHTLRAYRFK